MFLYLKPGRLENGSIEDAGKILRRFKSSFHVLNKSYISFSHPIFLEIIFELQKTVNDQKENELWSPFYGLDTLFLCYNHIMNVDENLASEPPSIYKSKSIRTVKTIIHNTPFKLNRLKLSQTIQISWISTNLMVKLMILLHWWWVDLSNTSTHTRAWKANQISSASQSYFFSSSEDKPLPLPLSPKPDFKSAKAFEFFPLSVHHGNKAELKPSAQQLVQNHNTIYIIKLNSPHTQCTVIEPLARDFLILVEGLNQYKFQPIYERGYQLNLGQSSPKIRLNFCTTYNQKTGIISVHDQVKRKKLHASGMETALETCLNLALGVTPANSPSVGAFFCLCCWNTSFHEKRVVGS
ncbi:hypothetical protein VP01_1454g1 [Puccinia sorghi]|uniref:Uncharacterized protein n=1 Tax=Puccinia sorghi TaxID=27349 RepID=A0A0L6VJX0_9BASI|nr:hypothetical protein VP01_1454g1 [Puccinia sorghi]